MASTKSGPSYLPVRVQPELRAEVQAYAKREGRSVSNAIRFACVRLLEEDRRQRARA